MNKKKIAFISTGALGILSVGVLSLIGHYFYNLAINPKTSKESIFGSKKESKETSGETVNETLSWLLHSSNYSTTYVNSPDGLKLHGYKILNNTITNKWVITVHGYTSEGLKMNNYAKEFYTMGYNILIPDLRGHGKSEGNYIGMGWDDRLDILEWINYILNLDETAIIVLHGVSMGAATVCMTSGEKLPNNVKTIIADCGYTSVWEQFSHQLKTLYSLPNFPVMNASSIITRFKAGYNIKEASALIQVAKSKTPILYIHGDKDDFVPYKMMDELYNATSSEKEKLTVKNAAHAKSATTNPELYWSTIKQFLAKHI